MQKNEESNLPCADKLAFDTKEKAQSAALTATWQHGTKLQVYRCTYCRLWHLSSSAE